MLNQPFLYAKSRHRTRTSLPSIGAVLLLLSLAGCQTAPVLNVESSVSGNISSQEVGDVISQVATKRGWNVLKRSTDKMVASIEVRSHSAIIEIEYDSKSYRIAYKSSDNLMHRKGKIHRNYNNWIAGLDRDIRDEFAAREAR